MNNRRDDYLREIETCLRHLPDVDREQELNEIAQHLDGLITASKADGKTESQATAAAITQFGAARKIGSGLAHVGEYPRFASVWETVLFCAPFAAFLKAVWFVFVDLQDMLHWGVTTYSSDPVAAIIRTMFVKHGLSGISWVAGITAYLILSSRYGWRGALRKAFDPTLTQNYGIRWLFLCFFIAKIVPYSITRVFVVPQDYSLLNVYGSAQNFYFVVWAAAMWISAFCVGRSNRRHESAAKAVSVAASLSTVYLLIFMVLKFISDVYGYNSHLPILVQLYGFTRDFALVLAGGVVNIFIIRLITQRGEKSRPVSQTVRVA